MQDFSPVHPEENPMFTQLETFPLLWASSEVMLRGSSYNWAIIFNMMGWYGVTLSRSRRQAEGGPELMHLPLQKGPFRLVWRLNRDPPGSSFEGFARQPKNTTNVGPKACRRDYAVSSLGMPQDPRVNVGKFPQRIRRCSSTFRRELQKMERSSLPAIGVRCPLTGI